MPTLLILLTTGPQLLHRTARDATSENYHRAAMEQGIDHNKPPGFAELKPEGEGTTEVRKRASQLYNHPMHGEETATIALK